MYYRKIYTLVGLLYYRKYTQKKYYCATEKYRLVLLLYHRKIYITLVLFTIKLTGPGINACFESLSHGLIFTCRGEKYE
jgi:hypothetical protein